MILVNELKAGSVSHPRQGCSQSIQTATQPEQDTEMINQLDQCPQELTDNNEQYPPQTKLQPDRQAAASLMESEMASDIHVSRQHEIDQNMLIKSLQHEQIHYFNAYLKNTQKMPKLYHKSKKQMNVFARKTNIEKINRLNEINKRSRQGVVTQQMGERRSVDVGDAGVAGAVVRNGPLRLSPEVSHRGHQNADLNEELTYQLYASALVRCPQNQLNMPLQSRQSPRSPRCYNLELNIGDANSSKGNNDAQPKRPFVPAIQLAHLKSSPERNDAHDSQKASPAAYRELPTSARGTARRDPHSTLNGQTKPTTRNSNKFRNFHYQVRRGISLRSNRGNQATAAKSNPESPARKAARVARKEVSPRNQMKKEDSKLVIQSSRIANQRHSPQHPNFDINQMVLVDDTDSKLIRQELQDIENAFKLLNGMNSEELDGLKYEEWNKMSKQSRLASKERLGAQLQRNSREAVQGGDGTGRPGDPPSTAGGPKPANVQAFNVEVNMNLRSNDSNEGMNGRADSRMNEIQSQTMNERNDAANKNNKSPNQRSPSEQSSSGLIKFIQTRQNCIDQQLKPLSPFSPNRQWRQLDLSKLAVAQGVQAPPPEERPAAQSALSAPASDESPGPWLRQVVAKKPAAQALLGEEQPLELRVAALQMQKEYKSIEAKELVIISCKQQGQDPNPQSIKNKKTSTQSHLYNSQISLQPSSPMKPRIAKQSGYVGGAELGGPISPKSHQTASQCRQSHASAHKFEPMLQGRKLRESNQSRGQTNSQMNKMKIDKAEGRKDAAEVQVVVPRPSQGEPEARLRQSTLYRSDGKVDGADRAGRNKKGKLAIRENKELIKVTHAPAANQGPARQFSKSSKTRSRDIGSHKQADNEDIVVVNPLSISKVKFQNKLERSKQFQDAYLRASGQQHYPAPSLVSSPYGTQSDGGIVIWVDTQRGTPEGLGPRLYSHNPQPPLFANGRVDCIKGPQAAEMSPNRKQANFNMVDQATGLGMHHLAGLQFPQYADSPSGGERQTSGTFYNAHQSGRTRVNADGHAVQGSWGGEGEPTSQRLRIRIHVNPEEARDANDTLHNTDGPTESQPGTGVARARRSAAGSRLDETDSFPHNSQFNQDLRAIGDGRYDSIHLIPTQIPTEQDQSAAADVGDYGGAETHRRVLAPGHQAPGVRGLGGFRGRVVKSRLNRGNPAQLVEHEEAYPRIERIERRRCNLKQGAPGDRLQPDRRSPSQRTAERACGGTPEGQDTDQSSTGPGEGVQGKETFREMCLVGRIRNDFSKEVSRRNRYKCQQSRLSAADDQDFSAQAALHSNLNPRADVGEAATRCGAGQFISPKTRAAKPKARNGPQRHARFQKSLDFDKLMQIRQMNSPRLTNPFMHQSGCRTDKHSAICFKDKARFLEELPKMIRQRQAEQLQKFRHFSKNHPMDSGLKDMFRQFRDFQDSQQIQHDSQDLVVDTCRQARPCVSQKKSARKKNRSHNSNVPDPIGGRNLAQFPFATGGDFRKPQTSGGVPGPCLSAFGVQKHPRQSLQSRDVKSTLEDRNRAQNLKFDLQVQIASPPAILSQQSLTQDQRPPLSSKNFPPSLPGSQAKPYNVVLLTSLDGDEHRAGVSSQHARTSNAGHRPRPDLEASAASKNRPPAHFFKEMRDFKRRVKNQNNYKVQQFKPEQLARPRQVSQERVTNQDRFNFTAQDMISLNDRQAQGVISQLVAPRARELKTPVTDQGKQERRTFLVNGKCQKIYTKISEDGDWNDRQAASNRREAVKSNISEINECNMSEEFKDFNSSQGGAIMQPKGHGSIEKLSASGMNTVLGQSTQNQERSGTAASNNIKQAPRPRAAVNIYPAAFVGGPLSEKGRGLLSPPLNKDDPLPKLQSKRAVQRASQHSQRRGRLSGRKPNQDIEAVSRGSTHGQREAAAPHGQVKVVQYGDRPRGINSPLSGFSPKDHSSRMPANAADRANESRHLTSPTPLKSSTASRPGTNARDGEGRFGSTNQSALQDQLTHQRMAANNRRQTTTACDMRVRKI